LSANSKLSAKLSKTLFAAYFRDPENDFEFQFFKKTKILQIQPSIYAMLSKR